MKNRLKNKFIYAFITLIMMMFTLASGNAYATKFTQAYVRGGEICTLAGYNSCWYQYCAAPGVGFGAWGAGPHKLYASPDMAFIFSTMKGSAFSANYLVQDPKATNAVEEYQLGWGGKCYQGIVWSNTEGTPGGNSNAVNFADVYNNTNLPQSFTSASNFATNYANNTSAYTYDCLCGIIINPSEGGVFDYDETTKQITISGKLIGNLPKIGNSSVVDLVNTYDLYNLNFIYNIDNGIHDKEFTRSGINVHNPVTTGSSVGLVPDQGYNFTISPCSVVSGTGDNIKITCSLPSGYDINTNLFKANECPAFLNLVTKDPGFGNFGLESGVLFGAGNEEQKAESIVADTNVGVTNLGTAHQNFVKKYLEYDASKTIDENLTEVKDPKGHTYHVPKMDTSKFFKADLDDVKAYYDEFAGDNGEYVLGHIKISKDCIDDNGNIKGDTWNGWEFSYLDGLEINTNVGKKTKYKLRIDGNPITTETYKDTGEPWEYYECYLSIPYEKDLTEVSSLTMNYKYLICGSNFTHYDCGGGQDQISINEASRWYETISYTIGSGTPLPYYLDIEKRVKKLDEDEVVAEGVNNQLESNLISNAIDTNPGNGINEIGFFDKRSVFSTKNIFYGYDKEGNPIKDLYVKYKDEDNDGNPDQYKDKEYETDENGNVKVDASGNYIVKEVYDYYVIEDMKNQPEPGYEKVIPKFKLKEKNTNTEIEKCAFEYVDENGHVVYATSLDDGYENVFQNSELIVCSNATEPILEVDYPILVYVEKETQYENGTINEEETREEIRVRRNTNTYSQVSESKNSGHYDNYIAISMTNYEDANNEFRLNRDDNKKEIKDWSFGWIDDSGYMIIANTQDISKVKPSDSRNRTYEDSSRVKKDERLVVFFKDTNPDTYSLSARNKADIYLNYEEAKELLGEENATFKFKVDIYNGEAQTQYVDVKAGTSERIGRIYSESGVSPTYEVTELDENGNEIKVVDDMTEEEKEQASYVNEMYNSAGRMKEGNTVYVVATNTFKKRKGKLRIKKVVDKPLKENTTFTFEIEVNYANGEKEIREVKIDGVKGYSEMESPEEVFSWYGSEAPTYEIKETNIPEGYEEISISPRSGVIEAEKESDRRVNQGIKVKIKDDGTLDYENLSVWKTGEQLTGDYKYYLYGNINLDDGNYINSDDSLDILRVMFWDNNDVKDKLKKNLADVNDDGIIDSVDAKLILARSVGLDVNFPVEHIDSSTIEVTATNHRIDNEPVTLTLEKEIDKGIKIENKVFKFYVKLYQIEKDENGQEQQVNVKEYTDNKEKEYTDKEKGYVELSVPNGNLRDFEYTPELSGPVYYEITEIDTDGTDFGSFTISDKDNQIIKTVEDNTVTGEIDHEGHVKVTATNKPYSNTANIPLSKTFKNESNYDRIATFEVKVTMPREVAEREEPYKTTKPDGFEESYSSDNEEVYYVTNPQIKVKAGETASEEVWFKTTKGWQSGGTWYSGEFKWYGDYELTYEISEKSVHEIRDGNLVDVSDEYDFDKNITGTLGDNKNNIFNNAPKTVKLIVKKVLTEDSEIDENQLFDFNVTVKNVVEIANDSTGQGSLNKTAGESTGTFFAQPSIRAGDQVVYEFKYDKNTLPVFRVKELDPAPDSNSEFVKIEASTEYTKPEEKAVTGTLDPSATVTVTATNKIEKKNKIEVDKLLADKNPVTTDEIFVFKLDLAGTTSADGPRYIALRVPAGNGNYKVRQVATLDDEFTEEKLKEINWTDATKYTTEDITFTGDNATYTISDEKCFSVDGDTIEDITGKYKPTGLPSTGKLDGTGSTIKCEIQNWETSFDKELKIKKHFNETSTHKRRITFEADLSEAVNAGYTINKVDNVTMTGNVITGVLEVDAGKNDSEVLTYATIHSDSEEISLGDIPITETKVKEDKNDDNNFVDVTGEYEQATDTEKDADGNTVIVLDNTRVKENEGHLKISKTFIGGDSTVERSIVAKVVITNPNGDIDSINEYAGFTKNGANLENEITLTIPVNSNVAVSDDYTFKWKGDTKLHYDVTELTAYEGGNKITINPTYPNGKSGDLTDNSHVTVGIENKNEENHKARLVIEKELDTTGNTNIDPERKYTFDIKVTGVKGQAIDVEDNNKKIGTYDESKGEWTYAVSIRADHRTHKFEFEYEGDLPTYTVTERKEDAYKLTDITDHTNTYEIIYKDNAKTIISGITGKLPEYTERTKEDGSKEEIGLITVTAKNKFPFSNHISISKEIGKPASGEERFIFEIKVNGCDSEYGAVKIEKGKTTSTHYSDVTKNGNDYTFVEWKEGSEWTSQEYIFWKGAPECELGEIKVLDEQGNDITDLYNPEFLNTDNGKVSLDGNVHEIHVPVFNYRDDTGEEEGYLTLVKNISGNYPLVDTVDFEVTIEPATGMKIKGANSGNNLVETVTVNTDGSPSENTYYWEYEVGADTSLLPKYTVKEINLPEGMTLESISDDNKADYVRDNNGNIIGVTGDLKKSKKATEETAEETYDGVKIIATNDITLKHGNVSVKKEFQNDKSVPGTTVEEWAKGHGMVFTAEVKVKPADGSVLMLREKAENGELGVLKSYDKEQTFTLTMSSENGWTNTTEEIYWMGDNAPTFTVQEVEIPAQFEYVSSEMGGNTVHDNNIGGTLVDKETKNVTITNQPTGSIVLTIDLAGDVWLDQILDYKGDIKTSEPNGVFDRNQEQGVPNVVVNVYKVIELTGNDGRVSTDPKLYRQIKTDDNGGWRTYRVGVPVVNSEDLPQNYESLYKNWRAYYNVEFVYDGQTYTPTTLLKYREGTDVPQGSVDHFEAYDNTNKKYLNVDKYQDSSMAKEVTDNSRNITKVYGDTPIDSNGITNGFIDYKDADGNINSKSITYEKASRQFVIAIDPNGVNGYKIDEIKDKKFIKDIQGNKIYPKEGNDSIKLKTVTIGGDTVYIADEEENSVYPIESKVKTTNDEGNVIEFFKSTATTQATGIEYPLDEDIMLYKAGNTFKEIPINTSNYSVIDRPANIQGPNQYGVYLIRVSDFKEENGEKYYYIVDKAGQEHISKNGDAFWVRIENGEYRLYDCDNFTREMYQVIYPYLEHINLGLVKKNDADLSLIKTIDNVKVVVKNKLYQFDYSEYYDFETDSSLLKQNIETDVINRGGEVTKIIPVGVYKSDYKYRAEIYNGNGEKYDLLKTFYENKGKAIEDTEMDVYLTYKIKVKNNSAGYGATIYKIDDYFDENLELITEDEKKYVNDGTNYLLGTDNNGLGIVAQPSYIEKTGRIIKWQEEKATYEGSDGINYKKMTAIVNINLASGTAEELKMTFKVNKKITDLDDIDLSEKANIAEISSYSTGYELDKDSFYTNAGKIDRDSAPGNVNIIEYNGDLTEHEKWYEDDTFAAPKVQIELMDNDSKVRKISGTVWEDKRTEKEEINSKNPYKYGDGIKNNGEKSVEGLTTELVEKVMIENDDGTFTAYDFVLPTDTVLSSLGNRTIRQATGFDTTVTTNKNGNYSFKNVPAGDYVVRFTYGDKEIKSQDYSSAKIYNGQDYKSSIYNLKNGDSESVLKLDNYNNVSTNNRNIAVDSEVRRLQVIQNSREITYKNGKVLASSYSNDYANKINEEEAANNQNLTNKDVLFRDYYMYADTPIIRFNDVNTENKYNLKNIDFALEERPMTELSLDKQIKEILITTSDGKKLMDAVYDINYIVDQNGDVTVGYRADNGDFVNGIKLNEELSSGIENLQVLNRDFATNNGFRYLNVDSEILQGTTITITYQLSLINNGEIDYTGKLADSEVDGINWDEGGFAEVCGSLSNSLAKYDSNKINNTTRGEYIGNHYYYGNGENDKLVQSTVEQLVDYVDNDMTFDSSLNNAKNTAWKSTNEFELRQLIEDYDNVKKDKVDDPANDIYGISYSSNGNLIISIEDEEQNKSLISSTNSLRPAKSNIIGNTRMKIYGSEEVPNIKLTVSKSIAAESDDIQIDNFAEILKYTNTVGRKDLKALTGNSDPAKIYKAIGDKKGMSADRISTGYVSNVYERDSSVTETVTLTPPTGTSIFIWRLQVAGAIAFGMAIVAGGIILIKKKVLK